MTTKLRAIDLCCGAGGWACAARGLPIEIVVAVDHWDRACQTYQLNFPATQVIRADLRRSVLQTETLRGEIDLILGGIPCNWLSRSRERRRRNKASAEEVVANQALLDACLAIVRQIDPPYWCLEDVPQLVGHLPPLTPYQILDSREYSSQRRMRCYVGHFPQPAPRPVQDRLAAHLRRGPYRIGKGSRGKRPVRRNCWGLGTVMGLWTTDRWGPTVCAFGSRRDSEQVVVDPTIPGGVRQPEWQEMASLQGYPADYVFVGSPTDVSVMVGNSVQIDTARAILEGIVEDWRETSSTAVGNGRERAHA